MFAPHSKDKKKTSADRQTDGPGDGKAPRKNSAWESLAMRPVGVQAKLTISQPGDAYEQEADQVADHVMRSSEPLLQRAPCACGGGCPTCSTQSNDPTGHEQLQTKHADGTNTQQTVEPAVVHQSLRSSGQPLNQHTRGFMEERFGHDFSGVRVHADDNAAEAARNVTARAFTTGRDIVFGANEYQPATSQGQKLIAHELTHVVQQNGHGESIQRAPAAGPAPSWTVAELKGLLDKCDGGLGIREKAKKANNDTEPTIIPGDGGTMTPSTGVITLDRTQDKCFAVQQLVQELSNMSRKGSFDALDNSALAGDVSREDYIKRTELIEYESGVKNVLTAFDACKDQWPCTTTPKEWARTARDFTDYYNNFLSAAHKENYGQWWDTNCRVPFDKKTGHRGETGAPAGGTGTQAMEHVAGSLWAKDADGKILPPALEDIRQGGVADCFLFAAMAAIVNTNPQNIVNMIVDHGDDSYTVTFKGIGFFSSAEQKVTADFPVGKHGNVGTRKAIWPLVIEQAYAQEKGGIDKLGQGGNSGSAIDDMLDDGPSRFNPKEETVDYIMGKVAKAKEKKWPMTISAPKKEGASTEKKEMADNLKGFYFWHAYTIIDVDAKGNRLKLFNPWGHSDPNGDGWVSAEQVRQFFISISIND
jgi:Domain of unknown function (DUF4157)/Calpain family cysteine protease